MKVKVIQVITFVEIDEQDSVQKNAANVKNIQIKESFLKFLEISQQRRLINKRVQKTVGIDPNTIISLIRDGKASLNICQNIVTALKNTNHPKRLDEIGVVDTKYHMPSDNEYYMNLRYGYYVDFHRGAGKTAMRQFLFREIIKCGNQKHNTFFNTLEINGSFKNESSSIFKFQLYRMNDKLVTIIAQDKNNISFSGAFLWCAEASTEHNEKKKILCGIWNGRDHKDHQPQVYRVYWATDEISNECLNQLNKFVTIKTDSTKQSTENKIEFANMHSDFFIKNKDF